jgi:hypothetical protein
MNILVWWVWRVGADCPPVLRIRVPVLLVTNGPYHSGRQYTVVI